MGFSVEGWIQDVLARLFMAGGGGMPFLGVILTSAICPFSILPSLEQHGLVIAHMLTVANLQRESQKKLMWSSGLLPGCIWAAARNDMYNCEGLPKKAGWI